MRVLNITCSLRDVDASGIRATPLDDEELQDLRDADHVIGPIDVACGLLEEVNAIEFQLSGCGIGKLNADAAELCYLLPQAADILRLHAKNCFEASIDFKEGRVWLTMSRQGSMMLLKAEIKNVYKNFEVESEYSESCSAEEVFLCLWNVFYTFVQATQLYFPWLAKHPLFEAWVDETTKGYLATS